MSLVRKIAAVAAVATVVGSAAPASAASAAPAPCRAHATTDGSDLTLVVTGQYVARPTDHVDLTCHVVQGGAIAASVHGTGTAGVAVVAGAVEVPLAPYSVCYEVWIWDITGWGQSYYTNCP